MPRTSTAEVQASLGANYGRLPDDTFPDLTVWIDMATTTVDELVVLAKKKVPPYYHTANQLRLIEAAVAAHYYTKMDPTYSSRSTMGASGSFIRDKTEAEPYKSLAIMLDPSGKINALLNRLVAGAAWLGKRPSEQVPIWQRP